MASKSKPSTELLPRTPDGGVILDDTGFDLSPAELQKVLDKKKREGPNPPKR